ncbi:response regulator [Chrysiogenes arsenatis]|uniref:response regulator n=1 Tax=Chrysiogenes arsenatis TaxID=309797 RepID=UPI0003F74A13|nr:response regulator [Chrysiogenes arsenatis]
MNHAQVKPFVILLVEDEPADAHLVKMALQENRVLTEVHHVSDGVEALEFLRRQGETFSRVPRPDLILLDLNMPRMDGRELLAALKKDEDFCGIPVVMLTTSDVERDVIASYKLGAAGYITKPVDFEQFAIAIRQLEGYWFTLVKLPENNT